MNEFEKYGSLMSKCGETIKFGACSHKKHGKQVIQGNFCNTHLCGTCQERRSIIARTQVLNSLNWHQEKNPTDVPLLLTLTTTNVLGKEINKAINEMTSSWKKIMKQNSVISICKSWVKSIKIKNNNEISNYNIYFYALIMVPKEYFEKNNDLYISSDEWLRLWELSMGKKWNTTIEIHPTKNNKKEKLKSLASKLTNYSINILSLDGQINLNMIRDLHHALKNKKLIEFGGIFLNIHEEMNMIDIYNADLNDIFEDSGEDIYEEDASKISVCRICKENLVEEIYKFNPKIFRYLRIRQ